MMKPVPLSLFALAFGAAVFAFAFFAGAFHHTQTSAVQHALVPVEQANPVPMMEEHNHEHDRNVNARVAILAPAVMTALKGTLGDVLHDIGLSWLEDVTGGFFGLLSNDDKKWDEINKKLDEIDNKLVAVQEKLDNLQAGIYDLKFTVVVQNILNYGNQIKAKWEILQHNLNTKNWEAQIAIYQQEDPYLKETWEAAFGIYNTLITRGDSNPFQILFTSAVYKGSPILHVYQDCKAFAIQWSTTLANAAVLLNSAASFRKQQTYQDMARKIMDEYIPKLELLLETSTDPSSPPILPAAFTAANHKILADTLASGSSPQAAIGYFKIRNHIGNLVHSACTSAWINNDQCIMDAGESGAIPTSRCGCWKASYGKECIRHGRMTSFGDNMGEMDVHAFKDTVGDGGYNLNSVEYAGTLCPMVSRPDARLAYWPYNRAGVNQPWYSVYKNILYGSKKAPSDRVANSRMKILWDRTEGNTEWFNFVFMDQKLALGWDEPMIEGDEQVEAAIAVFDETRNTYDFFGRRRNMFKLVTQW